MRKYIYIGLTVLVLAVGASAITAYSFRTAKAHAAVFIGSAKNSQTVSYTYLSKNGIFRELKFTLAVQKSTTIHIFTENLIGSTTFFLEGPDTSQIIGEGSKLSEKKELLLAPGDYSIMIDFRRVKAGATALVVETGE